MTGAAIRVSRQEGLAGAPGSLSLSLCVTMTKQIANAANTLIPAFLALQSKGYRVWWARSDNAPDAATWYAEGPLGRFVADNSVELLGLVAMRELRGSNWKANDQQIDDFMRVYNA